MKLFEVLAGRSKDYFVVGDVQFEAAPLTMEEYGEFLALPRDEKNRLLLDTRADFYADKLRRRVRGNRTDPATITPEWVLRELPVPHMNVLDNIFLYGKMPDEEGVKENTKQEP